MTSEQVEWLGNFGTNVLEFFANYNVQLTPRNPERLKEMMASLETTIKALQVEIALNEDAALRMKLKRELALMDKWKGDYQYAMRGVSQLTPMARELNQRAFVTNDADPDFHTLETLEFQNGALTQQMDVPKGDILHQFRKDVQAGSLPTVSWLSAPGKFSDHPYAPWYGAWYVSEVMDILTKNPEVWKKTIFILTYDENDGYFDHAPSIVAADPAER